MPRKHFRDRCGKEVTGEQSGAIHGIDDADDAGNGTTTEAFDIVCLRCYRAWVAWMTALQDPLKEAAKG
jgi:hypothetical protein